jgi:CO/xanthine dehydrogenase Mo-binding subunit
VARAGRVVGRALPRVDGDAKVRGRACYPQDRTFPADGLHAATVRAPVAAARLVAVDVVAALRIRGVVRVLTAADVRGTNRFGLTEADQPVLVEDRIRAASDVVAVVVATSERAARAGARRVGLRLEPTPLLTDPERACDPDAPVVHPERAAVADHPNVVGEARIRRGGIRRAFTRAAAVVEGVYQTSWVEHAFLAPEAGIAVPEPDGTLTLHVATQWPEADLRQAAVALGEPLDRLRLVQDAIGGAFGGREDVTLQILLLLAARATGRPVRMVWDRAESIRGHGKRHPFRIRHRLAADRDGRLVAADIDILADAGGYTSTSRAVVGNAAEQACGPYAIPAVDIRARAVFTNNPVTGAFRGFGVNQVCFAMEQQMNKLAAALGLTAATLRHRNFVRPGARLATGSRVATADGLPKTLAAATARARAIPLPRARDGWVHGRGLASALKNVGYGFGFDDSATARVRVTRDGEVVVAIGAAEVGQGITTVLTQIAAETLAVAPARVRIVWEDSRTAPEAGSTSASRQTLVSGNAVRGVCERLVRMLATRGPRAAWPADGVTASYTWHVPPTQPLGHPRPTRHAHTYGWSTVVADVAVEVATGRVRLRRAVVAVDAGRVINPALFRGQIEGGVVMGQGYALLERCAVRDGMPVGLRLDACNLPTAADAVPTIEIVAIESAEPCGPFGARGVGEIAMIPIVPAITAAIHAACGAWVDAIPARPDRVRAAVGAPASSVRSR